MAFEFRLEKILKLKKMKEDNLKKEYFECAESYNKAMKDLIDLKKMRDDAIVKRKQLERTGTLICNFDNIEIFLEGNKIKCITKIDEIKKRRKLMDNKRLELIEASKEAMKYEKLRELAFKEYRLTKEKIEIINLEELASSYYGREF